MLRTTSARQSLTDYYFITPKAVRRLSRREILRALICHARGSTVDFAGQGRPPRVRLEGCRRLSAYHAEDGTPFFIVSEPDDVLTTVMLPEEC